MNVVTKIIKALDKCIEAAREAFDAQIDLMRRVREEPAKSPIRFSNRTQISGTCLSCKKDEAVYSITGSWEEGKREGIADIAWNCTRYGKKEFTGTRSKTIIELAKLAQ